jgi:carboxylesterase type B
MSSDTIKHPTLGCSLRGKPSTTSVQFRNLKYASIPARFKESTPNDKLKPGEDGIFDATKFGPSCPHKRGAQSWDLTLVGTVTLPHEQGQCETENMDEFECLNINVTVPKSAVNAREASKKGLPVFVWVHGGGLSIGSNNWPQYDLQKFVNRSVELGKPVVAVAMNYRLGLFGFLANGELGAMGNMGYKDQVLAFRWIKKHIAGFGGDPSNITAAGESAGGISLSTLLCADTGTEGLFDRVIIMSGEATLRKSRNEWWHNQQYNDQATFFPLPATENRRLKSSQQHSHLLLTRLKQKLLTSPAEDLTQHLPLANHYCGYVDGQWLKHDATITLLSNPQQPQHKPSWCQSLVIGDAAHDGTILKARILDQPHVHDRLRKACAKYLTPNETQCLLSAYQLDHDLSPKKNWEALLSLASELRFYDPARRVHDGWKAAKKNASRYHFHVVNPFEGDYKGISSHELDVAFLLQNFNDQLDERNRMIAQAMADHFIGFAHGEAWAGEGMVVVFGSEGVVELDEKEYDREYRSGRGEMLGSIDAEKLWRVADMWQGVRSEEDENKEDQKGEETFSKGLARHAKSMASSFFSTIGKL